MACISAFILPTVREEDFKKVPQYVWDFIHQHQPVISANAFSISFYNGVDLYGQESGYVATKISLLCWIREIKTHILILRHRLVRKGILK